MWIYCSNHTFFFFFFLHRHILQINKKRIWLLIRLFKCLCCGWKWGQWMLCVFNEWNKKWNLTISHFSPQTLLESPEGPPAAPWTPLLSTTDLWSRILNHIPWSFPCDSDTLTASWLLKELTPIMPWEAVLASEGIWLWLRGTLYRASAMSAALFRMISWEAQRRQRFCYLCVFFLFCFFL